MQQQLLFLLMTVVVVGSITDENTRRRTIRNSLRCMGATIPFWGQISHRFSFYVYSPRKGILSSCSNSRGHCDWQWNAVKATEFVYDNRRRALKMKQEHGWLRYPRYPSYHQTISITPERYSQLYRIGPRVFVLEGGRIQELYLADAKMGVKC